MSKVKLDYHEFASLHERIRNQEREIQCLRERNERLEKALDFAKDLIPKDNLPVGVGINVVPWLINQGQRKTWNNMR